MSEKVISKERWQILMNAFGFDLNFDTYEKLVTAYSEKHRHYHSTNHLKHVLLSFDESRHLAEQPHEVELALWFHDAIYKIFAKNNELASAQWVDEFLKDQNANETVIQRVHEHIMATLHNGKCDNNDSALAVDIDLAILGTSEDIYHGFEKNVRKEYRLIPSFIYKKKRKEILQWFLDQKSIYHHAYFRDKYEGQARINLQNAIKNL